MTVMNQVFGAIVGAVIVIVVVGGCVSPEPRGEVAVADEEQVVIEDPAEIAPPTVKRPDLLDHKNFKFGRDVPEWATLEAIEIEALETYPDAYVFKFESPRAQDLQGAQIWTRNFSAATELAQVVQTRVQNKFVGAAVGDQDLVENYFENVVANISEVEFSGYRPVSDYWFQFRYYTADGSVDEDAYTYYVLYTIPRQTLDRLIRDALDGVDDASEPDTEEERVARDRVKEAFTEGI